MFSPYDCNSGQLSREGDQPVAPTHDKARVVVAREGRCKICPYVII